MRLFDGVEILPLNVLDQRHLEMGARLRHVSHDDRDTRQPDLLRRAPATFTRDDLKAVAGDALHDDRLDHAIGSDRLREFIEPAVIELTARLE